LQVSIVSQFIQMLVVEAVGVGNDPSIVSAHGRPTPGPFSSSTATAIVIRS
jgi:hypothetical protein